MILLVRAVAQEDSHWLHASAARVRAVRQVFPEYLGFPCHSFHRLLHTHHHLPSEAGTIGQIVADVPSGLSLTPKLKKTDFHGLSPRANYSDRRLSAKRLPTCADKGCHVISVTDPSGRILSVF
jgi:hypothetical protein